MPRVWRLAGARLRQDVHKVNTLIGYHIGPGLSSEKRVVAQFDV